MKYSQSYKSKRLSGGFYITIALCLLIIGGASWFALSRNTAATPTPQNSSSDKEYNSNNSSYTESVPELVDEVIPNTDVTQSVTDEPYSTPEATVEKTPVVSFTMPVEGKIIKNHDDKALQYSKTFGDMRIHTGIDIACAKGTAVSACSNGTVTAIELNTALGNTVTIEHANGITVKYSSLDNLKVKQGSKVSTGDIIGTAGTVLNECNDESHIHIEVFKNNTSTEPLAALGLN